MATRHRRKWRIRPIDEHGQRVSMVFDNYKTAKAEEHRFNARVEEVRRGLRTDAPIDKTFNELADYWMEHRAKRKRSCKDDESIIRKHLRPAFGKMTLREIGVEDVDDYLDERDDLSPKTLNNHLTLFRTMLKLATEFRVPWLLRVPPFKKPKISLSGKDYQWLRNDDEVRRFLQSAHDEGDNVYVFYLVATYTGMRAGELATLEWSDVDFERRIITVQRSFNGPTKSDRVRYVPILDPLLPVLKAWKLRHPGRLVFTNRDGEQHRESGRIFQEVFHRVLTAAGFPMRKVGTKDRSYIRFHDLRHTFASHWMMKGGERFKLQRMLGHQNPMMTERYTHLAPDAFAADYARLGSSTPIYNAEVVAMRPDAVASAPATPAS